MTGSKSLTVLSFVALCVVCLDASFVVPQYGKLAALEKSSQPLSMSDRGWDNADFLEGLSGDVNKRQQAADEYREFSEKRRAHMKRQMEMMKTPQGMAFLEQQQLGRQQQMADGGSPPFPDDAIFDNVQPGSGGGSRMSQMMAQAGKMKDMKAQMKEMGFEQKFAVPLDDDDDEEEDES